jgi:hypothetical protein
MTDEWARNTLAAINENRRKNHIPPLEWSNYLESAARRRSFDAKRHGGFKPTKPRFGQYTFWCAHWTPPQGIADIALSNNFSDYFHQANLLNQRIKSAAVALENDGDRTYVVIYYSQYPAQSHSLARNIRKRIKEVRGRLIDFLRSRWFLILLGLAIIFLSIAYYPSIFGESSFARWMEVPIQVFGAILILIGLFRRGYRRRAKLIRTLLIIFVLFIGCSYAYIRLDEAGKIDQWLHRNSSEGTISGNIKNKIPSLVETLGGLKLQTPVSTPTTTLPKPTTTAPRPTSTPVSNISRVWIGNAYLVGGDGNAITLVNNPNARNPSWSQLVDFLRQDPTDQMKYDYNSFVCADFAEMLHNNAEKAGWKAAYVSIELSGYPDYYNLGIPSNVGHALNAFQTTDRGLIYIDSTAPMVPSGSADKTVDVQVGKDYIPVSIFPQSGWESTWESMGRVTEIEVVQW